MRNIGTISILTPERHVKTLDRPLRIKEVQLADGSTGMASDGAPSDCVALALMGFIIPMLDLLKLADQLNNAQQVTCFNNR